MRRRSISARNHSGRKPAPTLLDIKQQLLQEKPHLLYSSQPQKVRDGFSTCVSRNTPSRTRFEVYNEKILSNCLFTLEPSSRSGVCVSGQGRTLVSGEEATAVVKSGFGCWAWGRFGG